MLDFSLWPLLISVAAGAIAAALVDTKRVVEVKHEKRMLEDEFAKLKSKYDVLNEGKSSGVMSSVTGCSGLELCGAVNDAKKTIVLTAFSKDRPSESYIRSILLALERGVSVTRAVPIEWVGMPEFDWVRVFRDYENYAELHVEAPLPFDIYVFDGQRVRLYFPADSAHSRYKNGVDIIDCDIALMFRGVFERLSVESKRNQRHPS